MKAKKILYAASNMRHINNFHLDYIKALREEGHEVFVMAKGEGADFDVPFEKRMFSKKNTLSRKMIKEICERENFDSIILNTSLAAFHIRLALKRSKRARVLNICHGYLFSEHTGKIKTALLLLAEKIVKGKTDAIITMNEADYRIATRHRLTRGKIYRSHGMGATIREIITSPENIRAEFFGEYSFVMTFVGELSDRKNQEFLIKGLAKIKETIPGAVLCLVGDGDKRDELLALASDIGVSESVIFTGQRVDACDFIRASDLYVSASRIEGMPFNLIEAMGAEKTVLASRIKGHEDLISDGVDGYLYDFNNLEQFINKTCQIYQNDCLDKQKIKEKYLVYERTRAFSEMFSLIKEAAL